MTENQYKQPPVCSVTIYGEPVAKQRPRQGAGGRFYTPEPTRSAEQVNALMIRAASRCTAPTPNAEFALIVRFYCRTRRGKDDDNMEKLIKDAITRAGNVWKDDRQCVETHMYLRRGDKEPRTELAIYEIDNHAMVAAHRVQA